MPIPDNPDKGMTCKGGSGTDWKIAKHMERPKERNDVPDYLFNALELSSHSTNWRHITILDNNAAPLVPQAESEAGILGMHKALVSNPLVFLHNEWEQRVPNIHVHARSFCKPKLCIYICHTTIWWSCLVLHKRIHGALVQCILWN